LVAETVKVEEAPAITDVGLAVMETFGAGLVTGVTVTVALAEACPPLPEATAV
jgi:hypothetical protein